MMIPVVRFRYRDGLTIAVIPCESKYDAEQTVDFYQEKFKNIPVLIESDVVTRMYFRSDLTSHHIMLPDTAEEMQNIIRIRALKLMLEAESKRQKMPQFDKRRRKISML